MLVVVVTLCLSLSLSRPQGAECTLSHLPPQREQQRGRSPGDPRLGVPAPQHPQRKADHELDEAGHRRPAGEHADQPGAAAGGGGGRAVHPDVREADRGQRLQQGLGQQRALIAAAASPGQQRQEVRRHLLQRLHRPEDRLLPAGRRVRAQPADVDREAGRLDSARAARRVLGGGQPGPGRQRDGGQLDDRAQLLLRLRRTPTAAAAVFATAELAGKVGHGGGEEAERVRRPVLVGRARPHGKALSSTERQWKHNRKAVPYDSPARAGRRAGSHPPRRPRPPAG
eukprot:SAG22_NODE_181_length_16048_cov_157.464418_21_plen_284_part_00